MFEPEAQTCGLTFSVIETDTVDSEAAAGRWSNVIFNQMHATTESLTSGLETMSTNACNAIRTLISVIPPCLPLAQAVADTSAVTINDDIRKEHIRSLQVHIPHFRG